MDGGVVGDVIAVVAQWRGEERQEPQGRNAKALEVIQLTDQPLEVSDAVAVAVRESADVQLVDNGVFVPEGRCGGLRGMSRSHRLRCFHYGCRLSTQPRGSRRPMRS